MVPKGKRWSIHTGDTLDWLRSLPDESVNCCVTSPPYWGLRDYGCAGQLGLEPTISDYVANMVGVFRNVRRVLRDDGTLWLNLGDSYASTGRSDRKESPGVGAKQEMNAPGRDVEWACGGGSNFSWKLPGGIKPKDLCGIPWRVAFALQADGWYLRQDIVWAKPNAMSESVDDRPCRSHEYVFLFSKSQRYWSDFDAIKTPPRESSMIRLAQDVQAQAGSHRANGGAKTNGAMKAVGTIDKQRGHSRRHAGFNDRWDAMERSEQQAAPATIRDVWFIATASYDGAHFAVMPAELVRRCLLAGCPTGGTVLEPFAGSGTTLAVAVDLGFQAIGCELNPEYVALAEKRIRAVTPSMFTEATP